MIPCRRLGLKLLDRIALAVINITVARRLCGTTAVRCSEQIAVASLGYG